MRKANKADKRSAEDIGISRKFTLRTICWRLDITVATDERWLFGAVSLLVPAWEERDTCSLAANRAFEAWDEDQSLFCWLIKLREFVSTLFVSDIFVVAVVGPKLIDRPANCGEIWTLTRAWCEWKPFGDGMSESVAITIKSQLVIFSCLMLDLRLSCPLNWDRSNKCSCSPEIEYLSESLRSASWADTTPKTLFLSLDSVR